MTCGLIMTKDPLTARESETVLEATRALIAHHYINLPVTDASGTFLGMFGIYDVLCLLIPRVALAGGLLPNLRFMSDNPEDLRSRFCEVSSRLVGEVADRDVVTVHPDTPEIEALRLFCKNHTTLAVVERESKKLVGIVSYWDAARSITGIRDPRAV